MTQDRIYRDGVLKGTSKREQSNVGIFCSVNDLIYTVVVKGLALTSQVSIERSVVHQFQNWPNHWVCIRFWILSWNCWNGPFIEELYFTTKIIYTTSDEYTYAFNQIWPLFWLTMNMNLKAWFKSFSLRQRDVCQEDDCAKIFREITMTVSNVWTCVKVSCFT